MYMQSLGFRGFFFFFFFERERFFKGEERSVFGVVGFDDHIYSSVFCVWSLYNE